MVDVCFTRLKKLIQWVVGKNERELMFISYCCSRQCQHHVAKRNVYRIANNYCRNVYGRSLEHKSSRRGFKFRVSAR